MKKFIRKKELKTYENHLCPLCNYVIQNHFRIKVKNVFTKLKQFIRYSEGLYLPNILSFRKIETNLIKGYYYFYNSIPKTYLRVDKYKNFIEVLLNLNELNSIKELYTLYENYVEKSNDLKIKNISSFGFGQNALLNIYLKFEVEGISKFKHYLENKFDVNTIVYSARNISLIFIGFKFEPEYVKYNEDINYEFLKDADSIQLELDIYEIMNILNQFKNYIDEQETIYGIITTILKSYIFKSDKYEWDFEFPVQLLNYNSLINEITDLFSNFINNCRKEVLNILEEVYDVNYFIN